MFKCMLIGNLVADPTFREVTIKATNETAKVANFRVAVNNRNQTYFVNVSAWRKLAEVCAYLKKGRKVYLCGIPSAQHGVSQKDGKIYDNLQLSVSEIQFLDARPAELAAPADPEPETKPATAEQVEAPVVFTEDDMPF